eukprot:709541_1
MLTVRYVEVAKKKEIKRMDPNIRPISKGASAPSTPEPDPVVQVTEEPQIVYNEMHNLSLQQKLNEQESDLQTANVILLQQEEMLEKEKDKMDAKNAEVARLQQQVAMLQT